MENDEITRYLASLEREDCYLVDATLKESAHEQTQRVFFIGANGAKRGPYVRKLIHRDAGMGAAYERIFTAQQQGKRFKHIPAILECYQHEELLVVVMEFVDGETLQDRVYRLDPSVQLATDVFPQLCDAATELHESFDPPLIHRDLKPSNVMLTDGGLTVIDFGIAREYKQGSTSDTSKFGTRAFAPPEQFGFGQTTVRSDVYALGMLLYYCLTEKIPTSQIRDGKFEEPDVPAELRPVLVRATQLDPAERYASAAELKGAFLEAANHQGAAPNLHAPRRAAAIVIILVIVAALAGAILVATSNLSDREGAAPGNQAPANSDSASASETANSSVATSSAEEVTEDVVLDDMQTSAPPRNSYDPTTNIVATVAGVSFQIPECFEATIEYGDNGETYYYAESGSTLAMIMTTESHLNPDENAAADGFKTAKDSFLSGLVKSNEELFDEIVSSTDCKLAGHTARIVTLKGTVDGLPVTTKAVYFIHQDAPDNEITIGSVMFGQTGNAQFDYSTDFARTVASATPVTR